MSSISLSTLDHETQAGPLVAAAPCDAYHRVMRRQLIDSYEDAAACSDHYSHADLGLCFS
jgi:hypothetical protein